MSIPYWQQRQEAKLKEPTGLKDRGIPKRVLGEKSLGSSPTASKTKTASKKKSLGQNPKKAAPKKGKRINHRAKKMAKAMRQLGKINKELLKDGTEECEIRSPVCAFFATVVNHNAGRVGAQLLNREDMTICCPPCNDYIEKNHAWAEERGFKKRRHGKNNS